MPANVRPIVKAARQAVSAAAPRADELICMTEAPRARSYLWKLFSYVRDGEGFAGLGTFPRYAVLFFHRGSRFADPEKLLQGSGKTFRFVRLQTPADARRPALKRLVAQAYRRR